MTTGDNLARVEAPQPEGRLEGIGGWLALLAIGQVLGPIRAVATLARYFTDSQTQEDFRQFPLAMDGMVVLNLLWAGVILLGSYVFFAKNGCFRECSSPRSAS